MNGYDVIPARRLLSNIVMNLDILLHDDTISPQDFLGDIRPTVVHFFGEKTGHKVMLTLSCIMDRVNVATGEIEQMDVAYFSTLQLPVYRATDLESMYDTMSAKMIEEFVKYLRNGSGWRLKKVKALNIKLSRNRTLKGSSYLTHPKGLKTRSPINIEKRKDDLCLMWSILRLMYPIDDKKNGNPKYIKDLKPRFNELNLEGVEFPTPCCERTFKRQEKKLFVSGVWTRGLHRAQQEGRRGRKGMYHPLVCSYCKT